MWYKRDTRDLWRDLSREISCEYIAAEPVWLLWFWTLQINDTY